MRYLLIFLLSLPFQVLADKTLCYDLVKEIPCGSVEFPRQAGDYAQQANEYESVSSDIVKDSNTNLLWLKCTLGDFCDQPRAMAWSEARHACAAIRVNQQQWRLPTVMELNTLIELERKGVKKINTEYFPNTQASGYWTGTSSLTYKTRGSRAWFVHFSRASIFDAPINSKHFVRCVHKTGE